MLTQRFDPEVITEAAKQLGLQLKAQNQVNVDLKSLRTPNLGYHWVDISDYGVLTINPKSFAFVGYAKDEVMLYTVALNSQSPKTIFPVYDAIYNEIHLIREDGSSVLVWAAKIPVLKSIKLAYSFKNPDNSIGTALVPRANFSGTEEGGVMLQHSQGGTHVLVRDCYLQAVSNMPVPHKRKAKHQREGVYPSTTSIDDIQY